MIHLEDYLYEAELNMEWWNSKSPAYQKRYLSRHPNSIYAQKAKSGELKIGNNEETSDEKVDEKPAENKALNKIEKARLQREEQIKINKEYLDKVYPKYQEVLAQWRAIPSDINRRWENGGWVYATPEDEANDKQKEYLRGIVRSYGADIDRVKHNIEVAERYLAKLHRKENFEARLATPNATTQYAGEGLAKVVDFAGMDKETEDSAVDAVKKNIEKYPFMKGHLQFLGSHKSDKFRELSDQSAHDFYYDYVEKEYNKAKDYLAQKMEGYTGEEKDPSRAYQDEDNWTDPAKRDNLRYYMFTANEAYNKMNNIDSRGGIEGYLRTPTYQKAIAKWRRMNSRYWAFYRTDELKGGKEGVIVFNENKFDNSDAKHAVEIKWHPEGCDTKKATLDHEFGHSIWYHLGLNKLGTPNVNGNDSLGRSPLQKFIAQEMYYGRNHVKENLSEYAATNQSEFFAEAYSEYLNNPNPRPIAKKVGELLDQEIKSRGYAK